MAAARHFRESDGVIAAIKHGAAESAGRFDGAGFRAITPVRGGREDE
jgi:hypothetical protein